jgi:hypothetical protein
MERSIAFTWGPLHCQGMGFGCLKFEGSDMLRSVVFQVSHSHSAISFRPKCSEDDLINYLANICWNYPYITIIIIIIIIIFLGSLQNFIIFFAMCQSKWLIAKKIKEMRNTDFVRHPSPLINSKMNEALKINR